MDFRCHLSVGILPPQMATSNIPGTFSRLVSTAANSVVRGNADIVELIKHKNNGQAQVRTEACRRLGERFQRFLRFQPFQ